MASSTVRAASGRRRKGRSTPENKRRWKRVLIGCVATAVLIAAVTTAVALVFLDNVRDRMHAGIKSNPDVDAQLHTPAPEQRHEPFYMIIMGVDSRDGETSARSDTLIVARIDTEQQSATLIFIPRDTRVSIPGHGRNKINAANVLGGSALVIETVKEFTGLPITYFMEVDFNGFREIVDAMGGVTVDVPKRIRDLKAADYDRSSATIDAGEQRLTGAQALTFVRSRAFPTGDFARIENQKIFIRALLSQGLQFGNALKLPAIADAVADSVKTNMSITEMLRLADHMRDMTDENLRTVTVPGEPKNISGGSYVIADEAALARMIERVSQGLSPEPEAGEGGTLPELSTITVDVRNGARVAGVAADAADRLSAAGVTVVEVGNTNQPTLYDETLIVYRDGEAAALAIREVLGGGTPVASQGMYSFETDILLVVGRDWGELSRNR